MPQQITLMDKGRIDRTIKRLAFQIWERLDMNSELVVIGLNDRGFATATSLVSYLEELSGTDITLYQFHVFNTSGNKPIPNCTEKHVLIVDDVIFSGKTIFSAISTICHSNDPDKIEVVSLVDRGHRTYPILSGLTGINVPTKFGEHIEVILNANKVEQVVLFKNI